MNLAVQIAKHIRDVFFGENWTSSNLRDNLEGVDWQQATTQVYSFNTIATLVYHINYFVRAVLKVLHGEPLNASDKYSFDHPPILSKQDWQTFLNKVWADAEHFAVLVERMPDSKLWENLAGDKYGNYYSNIHGIIEHAHYHLGQIVLIKKLLLNAG